MRRPQLLWQTIFRTGLCLLFLPVLYAGRIGILSVTYAQMPLAPVSTASPIAVAQSDAPCARCHADITSRYLQTPHALASGPALTKLIPGVFTQTGSGMTYSIGEQKGAAWLRYTDALHPRSMVSTSSTTISAPVISASRTSSRRTDTFLSRLSLTTRTSRTTT